MAESVGQESLASAPKKPISASFLRCDAKAVFISGYLHATSIALYTAELSLPGRLEHLHHVLRHIVQCR